MPWSLVEVQGGDTSETSALQLRFLKKNVPLRPPEAARIRLPLAVEYSAAEKQETSTRQVADQLISRPDKLQKQLAGPDVSNQLYNAVPHKPMQRRAIDMYDYDSPANRRSHATFERAVSFPTFDYMQRGRGRGDAFRLPAAAPGKNCAAPSPRMRYPPGQDPSEPLPSARRAAIVTPRSRVEADVNAPKQALKAPTLTPRSRNEADTIAARAAQKKNMVLQYTKRLQNKDWASRKVAVDALAEIVASDPSALEYVVLMLDSKSNKSRQTAVWALSRIVNKGDPVAVEQLLKRLEHPALEVRMAAQSALQTIAVKGDVVAVQGVLRQMQHRDWSVREAAVDALQHVAKQGDDMALQGLAGCLRDADWRVRQVATEVMVGMVNSQSLPSLRFILECFTIAVASHGGEETNKDSASKGLNITCAMYHSIIKTAGIPSGKAVCKSCQEHNMNVPDSQTLFKCAECLHCLVGYVRPHIFQNHALAFLMGGHVRLGSKSWVLKLDTALLPCILEQLQIVQ